MNIELIINIIVYTMVALGIGSCIAGFYFADKENEVADRIVLDILIGVSIFFISLIIGYAIGWAIQILLHTAVIE